MYLNFKKTRYLKKILRATNILHIECLLIIFLLFLLPNFVLSESLQENLEQHFDIVETFDQLQDWKGKDGLRGYDFSKTNMPKKIDGSNSIWDMYDDWSYQDSTEDWIKNHGPANVWKGSGKSLRMDLTQDSNAVKVGPSRFGLYFGSDAVGVVDGYATSGLDSSGYKEIYYFYMVKIPNNIFPTTNGGIWPNDTYKWWRYHKFATMSAGFTSAKTLSGAGGCKWAYGCSYILTELKQCGSSTCSSQYSSTFVPSNNIGIVDFTNPSQTWIQKDVVVKDGIGQNYLNTPASEGKWMGIEYHVSSGTPGNANGIIEIWVYEEDGTAHLVTNRTGLMMMQEETDISYNKFFFGGNLSYQVDVIAQQLDVTYYIDDFIIDKQRIGPTYFQLIAGIPANNDAPVIKNAPIIKIITN